MPAAERIVRGPDGSEQHFPGDATDAEISAALEAIPAANAKSSPKAPTWTPLNVLAAGRKSAQVKDERPDSPVSQWFEQHLRPVLESAAHPQTLDDVAQLLLTPVDATRGVGTQIAGQAIDAVAPQVPAAVRAARAATAAGMRLTSDVLESPATTAGISSVGGAPAGIGSRAVGRVLKFLAKYVEPAANGPRGVAGYDRYAPSASGYEAPAAGAPATTNAATPTIPRAPVGQAISTFAAAAPKAKLTAEEVKAGMQLVREGAHPDDVLQAILRLREVPDAWKHLPSNADVTKAVTERNATGRWTTKPEE